MSEGTSKLPLRRLESPIHKFTKVVIPTDLQRLQQHQHNIEKFQRAQQWDKLHQEHINSSRTVQQLRSNLREMEKLCGRVRGEDAAALEKLVSPTREQASAAALDFLRLHSHTATHPLSQPKQPTPNHVPPTGNVEEEEDDDVDAATSLAVSQMLLPAIPPEQFAAESWGSLEEDLLELSGLVNEFALLVHAQQEKIDSIEDNVSVAAANVEEGARSLGKAASSSLAVLPMAGALVGGVLGGPLGLMAGFKLAGVATALGGGIIGFASGNMIRRRKRERVEVQLQQLDNVSANANADDAMADQTKSS
ncbi:syntaxin-17 [Engraulis encrasicolus]|uniref:syntaxin-17 n=1 Tax=Engraulis encrasicolus TaxID=184585 RepID=UPI002FD5D8CD